MVTDKRIWEGTVSKYFDKGNASGFGFLEYCPGGARNDRMFYTYDEIEPDNIGRRTAATIVGTPVRFRIEQYAHPEKQLRLKAVEVTPVFMTDVENPESHRECSVVHNFVIGSGKYRAAFLDRESGDQALLTYENVSADHKDLFPKLKVGDHVWHGVIPPSRGKNFLATFAEFYSEQEENEMAQELVKC
jgi:hypothetical protein